MHLSAGRYEAAGRSLTLGCALLSIKDRTAKLGCLSFCGNHEPLRISHFRHKCIQKKLKTNATI